MTISTIKLYDLLSSKVGKDSAETLTTYIEEKIKDEFADNSKMLATKEDLANTKAEIIKWMFIFWIGQVAVFFSAILLFLKR